MVGVESGAVGRQSTASADAVPVEQLAYADAASRLVAYVVDSIVVAILIFAVALVLTRLLGPTLLIGSAGVPRVSVDHARALLNSIVAAGIGTFYFVGTWMRFGATPGQALLGIRVRRVDGGRLGIGPAVLRWALLGAPIGLLVVGVLPALPASIVLAAVALWDVVLLVTTALDDRKRGLHDRLAGSVALRRVRLAVT